MAITPGDSLLVDRLGESDFAFESSYVLGEEINSGSFGIVYETHHVCNKDEKLAVKVIQRDSKNAEKEALHETAILQQLRNVPNVTKLIDFFMDDNEMHIVQELGEGGDVLDRLSQRENYTENDALELATTLLSTIDCIHKHNIVHRDLKPGNLLLKDISNNSRILLCDFGLAKQLPADENSGLLTFCGTPEFVAPEIIDNQQYREKVDTWSIGCILFLLLGGKLPFGEEGDMQLYDRVLEADYDRDFEDEAWDYVSGSAKKCISNLLQLDPKKRWSAAEALESTWFSIGKEQRSSRATNHIYLKKTHNRIKKILIRRKLKAACHVIKISNMAMLFAASSREHQKDLDNTNHGVVSPTQVTPSSNTSASYSASPKDNTANTDATDSLKSDNSSFNSKDAIARIESITCQVEGFDERCARQSNHQVWDSMSNTPDNKNKIFLTKPPSVNGMAICNDKINNEEREEPQRPNVPSMKSSAKWFQERQAAARNLNDTNNTLKHRSGTKREMSKGKAIERFRKAVEGTIVDSRFKDWQRTQDCSDTAVNSDIKVVGIRNSKRSLSDPQRYNTKKNGNVLTPNHTIDKITAGKKEAKFAAACLTVNSKEDKNTNVDHEVCKIDQPEESSQISTTKVVVKETSFDTKDDNLSSAAISKCTVKKNSDSESSYTARRPSLIRKNKGLPVGNEEMPPSQATPRSKAMAEVSKLKRVSVAIQSFQAASSKYDDDNKYRQRKSAGGSMTIDDGTASKADTIINTSNKQMLTSRKGGSGVIRRFQSNQNKTPSTHTSSCINSHHESTSDTEKNKSVPAERPSHLRNLRPSRSSISLQYLQSTSKSSNKKYKRRSLDGSMESLALNIKMLNESIQGEISGSRNDKSILHNNEKDTENSLSIEQFCSDDVNCKNEVRIQSITPTAVKSSSSLKRNGSTDEKRRVSFATSYTQATVDDLSKTNKTKLGKERLSLSVVSLTEDEPKAVQNKTGTDDGNSKSDDIKDNDSCTAINRRKLSIPACFIQTASEPAKVSLPSFKEASAKSASKSKLNQANENNNENMEQPPIIIARSA